MGVVWHGSYSAFFEDAREAWGKAYGLGYLDMFRNGFYAPLVDLHFQFKRPIRYGQTIRIDAIYKPTEAAKLIFDYEIHDEADDALLTTGRSVQVFMNTNYELLWENPPFVEEWKAKMLADNEQQ